MAAIIRGHMRVFHRIKGARSVNDRCEGDVLDDLADQRRLGTMEEFASFCLPYVDGTSRFTTGQATAYAGGWIYLRLVRARSSGGP